MSTSPTTQYPRRYHLMLLLAAVATISLVGVMGIASDSLAFAMGAACLAAFCLLRPQYGVLVVIALSSADLVGTVEMGRFTVRVSQLAAFASAMGCAAQLLGSGAFWSSLLHLPRALWVFSAFSLFAVLRLWLFAAPNAFKGYGYAVWGLFDTLLIAGCLVLVLNTRRRLARALQVLVAAVTAISLFGLFQWFCGVVGWWPPLVTQWMGTVPRINGLSYEPSYFAFSTMLGLVLVVVLLLAEERIIPSYLAAVCCAVQIVALVLASSRSGWIGLILLTVVLVVATIRRRHSLRRRQKRSLWIVLAGYCLAIALIAFVRPAGYVGMAAKGMDFDEQSSSAPRLEGVRRAWFMFVDNPVLGVGLGQFGGVLAKKKDLPQGTRDADAMVTYNLYAELLAETGLIGFGLALLGLLLVASAAWRCWRAQHRFVSSAGVALLWSGIFIFGVMYQFNQTLFRTDVWCLIGLVLAVESLAKREEVLDG